MSHSRHACTHLRVYLTTQPRLRRSDTKAGVMVASPAAGTSCSSSMSDGRTITRVLSVTHLKQAAEGVCRGGVRAWECIGCDLSLMQP